MGYFSPVEIIMRIIEYLQTCDTSCTLVGNKIVESLRCSWNIVVLYIRQNIDGMDCLLVPRILIIDNLKL